MDEHGTRTRPGLTAQEQNKHVAQVHLPLRVLKPWMPENDNPKN